MADLHSLHPCDQSLPAVVPESLALASSTTRNENRLVTMVPNKCTLLAVEVKSTCFFVHVTSARATRALAGKTGRFESQVRANNTKALGANSSQCCSPFIARCTFFDLPAVTCRCPWMSRQDPVQSTSAWGRRRSSWSPCTHLTFVMPQTGPENARGAVASAERIISGIFYKVASVRMPIAPDATLCVGPSRNTTASFCFLCPSL